MLFQEVFGTSFHEKWCLSASSCCGSELEIARFSAFCLTRRVKAWVFFVVYHLQHTNLFRSSRRCSLVGTCRPIDQVSLHCDKTYYRVATPLLWNPGTPNPRHKMAAYIRAWFSIDNRFYHTEPSIGSTASTDSRRTVYSVSRHTSNMAAFEMIGNSLLCCSGKNTTERQGRRLRLGTKPFLVPKGLLRNGEIWDTQFAICNTCFVCSFDDSVKFSCDLFGYDICED